MFFVFSVGDFGHHLACEILLRLPYVADRVFSVQGLGGDNIQSQGS